MSTKMHNIIFTNGYPDRCYYDGQIPADGIVPIVTTISAFSRYYRGPAVCPICGVAFADGECVKMGKIDIEWPVVAGKDE